MNIDYSYRAFLITCLIFGALFLVLISVKLGNPYPVDEAAYDFELAEEETFPDEELAQLEEAEKRAIETNQAYNEAEKFLKEVESMEEEADDKLAEMDAALDETATSDTRRGIRSARKKIKETREKVNWKKNGTTSRGSSNKNTTISYFLPDRRKLYLPNPVYTCDGGGTIVINITVNALGRVIKTDYDRKASTTQNGCLIESAIIYAEKARFNTDSRNEKQKGSITYYFPGQD